jgi:uncharacterized protein DUF4136
MRTIARSLIGLAIAASSLWPAAAAAQKVSYDFRQHEDLARPKTFGFRNLPAVRAETRQTATYDSPFVDERTNLAIAAQLEQRGWTRNDEKPDVFVVTRRTFWKEYTTYGPYWGPYYSPAGWWGPYPYGWGYGWAAWDNGSIYAVEQLRGSLTVDLEDASTGQLLWRGVGEKHVHERSKPSSSVRHVNEQVQDIFKKFPPPVK